MSKILVITIGRTGSTNLCKGIADTLNLQLIDEPFNPLKSKEVWSFNQSKIKSSKDIIVKHIWFHTIDNIFYLDFLKILIQDFDEVFILTRKNIKEHFESIVNLKYKTKLKQDIFEKYVFEDIPSSFIKNYKDTTLNLEKLKKHNKDLKILAEETNIKIIYYEDIYSDNIDSNFSVIKKVLPSISNDFKKFLDNKNRQRIFDSKKQTI